MLEALKVMQDSETAEDYYKRFDCCKFTHMNRRSKLYHDTRKAARSDKKGSATNAGYDEQNEKTSREPKKNPAAKDVGKKSASEDQDDKAGA